MSMPQYTGGKSCPFGANRRLPGLLARRFGWLTNSIKALMPGLSVDSSPADGRRRRMTPVRCALVGLGMMGIEHAEILASSAAAELVVCCDLDDAARARVPDGAAFTTSLDEALDAPGLEAVFIATPQSHHLA